MEDNQLIALALLSEHIEARRLLNDELRDQNTKLRVVCRQLVAWIEDSFEADEDRPLDLLVEAQAALGEEGEE